MEAQRENFKMNIRYPASSYIRKNALRRGLKGTFGFLIGDDSDDLCPVVDMSLHSITIEATSEIFCVPEMLEQDLQPAVEVAKYAGAKVIGVYLAMDDYYYPGRRNMIIGLMLDAAAKMNLKYLAFYPTNGGETDWARRIYSVRKCFNCGQDYSPTGRKSNAKEHNPRRILALWSKLRMKKD